MKKIGIFLKIIVVGLMVNFLGLSTRVFAVNNELPELYIKAINPGYTVDGISNVGEMIEIGRKESDTPVSLAGAAVGYTNSSGNTSILLEFPENSWMSGETLLLRLASSPSSELAALNYTKTLAFKAGLTLKIGDEVIDEVCWNGKEGCYNEFTSSNPTTLVRNLETLEFEHLKDYEPNYDEKAYYAEENQASDESEVVKSQCKGLQFSEILSYYETLKSEQFIEFYNPTAEQILVDGCKIKYKNKTYGLTGVVKAEGFFTYYPTEFNLTKNPTNSNMIELLDVNGEIVDSLTYPNGQRKGTTYILVGYDKKGDEIWKVSYAPTPNEANNYQEYKTCEAGKVINEETGNCVKVTSVTEKVCQEGYYLNPLTGRCRKIEVKKETVCKEGYYKNPLTGRCKKIVENKGADYSLEPENYEEKSSFIALYVVLGVIAIGIIYIIYEFRKEIIKFFGKFFRKK